MIQPTGTKDAALQMPFCPSWEPVSNLYRAVACGFFAYETQAIDLTAAKRTRPVPSAKFCEGTN